MRAFPSSSAITEGIPALDMVKVKGIPERQSDALDRPELSGNYQSRQMQDRDHAGPYS
jgi:hypothetical protein